MPKGIELIKMVALNYYIAKEESFSTLVAARRLNRNVTR
jgi:hypothetical protein